MSEQKQRGGLLSQNTQISITYEGSGLSYSDVRDIARDVIRSELEHLAPVGRELFEQRADELREEIIEKLSQSDNYEERLQSFAKPHMQYALYEAQKGFGITGDEELKVILAGMVSDLSAEDSRSLRSIALQEAVSSAPKLTSEQLKILSLIFLHNYTQIQMNSLNLYIDYIRSVYVPLARNLTIRAFDIRHIASIGCASLQSLAHRSFEDVLRNVYPGFVSQGYTRESLEEAFSSCGGIPAGAIAKCLHAPELWQINAVSREQVEGVAARLGWGRAQVDIIIRMLTGKLMDDNQIKEKLFRDDDVKAVVDLWNESKLGSLSLTSVGVSIAYIYARSAVGSRKLPDLSVWI